MDLTKEIQKTKKKIKLLSNKKETKACDINLSNQKLNELKISLAKENTHTYQEGHRVKQNKNIQNVRFKSGIVKFSKLYDTTNLPKRYLLSLLFGVISGLATLFFIQNTGLYSPGLSGAIQGASRMVRTSITNEAVATSVYNFMFWGLYFIANIPLCIFAYYKVGKHFAIMTILQITGAQITGLVVSFIPGASDIMIFGSTVIDKDPNSDYYNDLIKNDIQLLSWSNTDQASKIPSLIAYGFAAAITDAIPIALNYIIGGSSGGTDVLSFYYARKKNKPIGTSITYLNALTLVFGIIIGSFGSASMINIKYATLENFFSPNMMVSIMTTILMGLIYNYYFPKHKIIKVQVYSNKVREIRNHLVDENYSHALTINNTIGGYKWTSNQNIDTVCMYVELPELIYQIRKIDEECLITTQRIIDVDGYMAVSH